MPPDIVEVEGVAAGCVSTGCGWTPRIDEVYGYSFILTNLEVGEEEKLAEVEWWYRHCTDIEELNRNAKIGAALRHLPSADHRVNSVWMWARLPGSPSRPESRKSPAWTTGTGVRGRP